LAVVELAALLTSAAALAVSGVALYLASLRPAEIVVDFVPDLSELRHSAMSGDGLPSGIDLMIAAFISNEGARGGVLQGLGAFDVRFEGSDEWHYQGGPSGPYRQPTTSVAPFVFPVAYEAGDAEAAYLILRVACNATDPRSFAAAIRDLRAVRTEISWSYQRSTGVLRRRRRELKTRSSEIKINPGLWRAELVKSWQTGPGGLSGHQAPLAEIAQGIRPATDS
jgi:hypothetical protein